MLPYQAAQPPCHLVMSLMVALKNTFYLSKMFKALKAFFQFKLSFKLMSIKLLIMIQDIQEHWNLIWVLRYWFLLLGRPHKTWYSSCTSDFLLMFRAYLKWLNKGIMKWQFNDRSVLFFIVLSWKLCVKINLGMLCHYS